MRATNYHRNWSANLAKKARFTPVLILIAVLFLFCLPLTQIELTVSGIQHPAVALGFLMTVAIFCIGIQQIARQEQWSLTPLTYRLAFCATFLIIPAFYLHAQLGSAILHVSGITLSLLLFFTLQQFSFNYHQRQYLLWIPMLSGWFIALMWALFGLQKTHLLNIEPFSLEPNSSAIILLSSLVLSAYILARTHIYKRSLAPAHLILLTTPLVIITTLMGLSEPQLLPLTLLLVMLPQLFMFRFCQKIHHVLWNISALLGFFLGIYLGWIDTTASFFTYFSPEETSVLKQTIALLKTVQFEGVGIGQLATKQLLFGLEQQNMQPILTPYPSWLLLKFAEGGLVTWISVVLFSWIVIKRLSDAPNGTRLMLTAILLPTLYGIAMTAFIDLNPILVFFFIIQLYWIDNLTTRYHRIKIKRVRNLTPLAMGLFITTSVVVFTSVYIGEQAQDTERLSNKKIQQYEYHPWWSSFYQELLENRLFLQNIEDLDEKAQEAYLRKQMIEITKNPTSDNYRALIESAILAEQDAITQQLQIEANLLFPASFPKPPRDNE